MHLNYLNHNIAGPIVRAGDLLSQFKTDKKLTSDDFSEAVFLIALGLIKKIVIADFIAINLVDRVFEMPDMMSSLETLVGVYAYTLQIYCDFSAYSDIAIGSSLLLGFRLPQNFNKPFAAIHPSDFWRRWHITLSTWLRDYLYIPLGGSRNTSEWKIHRNLILTMLLGGLWHGAGWNFVLWGGLHGIALSINRILGFNKVKKDDLSLFKQLLGMFITFNFVVFAFVFFRASSISFAFLIFKHIFEGQFSSVNLTSSIIIIVSAGFLFHFTPDFISEYIKNFFKKQNFIVQSMLLIAIAYFLQKRAITEVVPFIYFN